jgi:hypothetical protein
LTRSRTSKENAALNSSSLLAVAMTSFWPTVRAAFSIAAIAALPAQILD